MARRTSPIKVKQHAARVREFKRANRVDLSPEQVREMSRDKADRFRKRNMPSFLALKLERAFEARLLRERGEGAVKLRRAILSQ